MNETLIRFFSINYRTTILGIGVIIAAVGRLAVAYKSQDFASLASDGQLIMETAAALLAGVGLYVAKDSSVTGTGGAAKTVDSEGTLTNVVGTEVGKQPTVEEVKGSGTTTRNYLG